MRLHQLDVTAFGPFAATVSVDFDTLNDAGLFLLTGPTGAGKTSLLDAVCFALFGEVPGDRQDAKRLRSDLAATAAAPRVELDFTAAGRRFRVARSPEWQRPKLRGSGTTKEPSKVVLDEHVAGSWTNRSTRIDETADLVNSVLGMSARQFTQVAMLPQGGFAAFLRSGSNDRKQVLENLFGTRRFRDMEHWLVERRKVAHRANQLHADRVKTVIDQVGAVAHLQEGEVAPDDTDLWPRWAAETAGSVRTAATAAETAATQADAAASDAHQALAAAETVQALQARGLTAQTVLARQAEDQALSEQRTVALDAAERAREVTPLLEPLGRAEAEHERAADGVAEAGAELSQNGIVLSADADPEDWLTDLEALGREGERRATRLDALASEAERETALEERVIELSTEVDVATADVSRAETLLLALPGRIKELESRQHQLTSQAALVDAARQGLTNAQHIQTAARGCLCAEQDFEAANQIRRDAVDAHQQAVAGLQRLTAERLAGAAAALASLLTPGEPCQVCGSHQHPAPAEPIVDLPSEADEQVSQVECDRAAGARESAERLGQESRLVWERLRTEAGGADASDAAVLVTAAEHALAESEAAAATLSDVQAELVTAKADLDTATGGRSWAQQRQTEAATTLIGVRAEVERVRTTLTHELGDEHDVRTHLDVLSGRQRVVDKATASVRALVQAQSVVTQARTQAAARAAACGFADVGEVQGMALDTEERAQLRRALTDRAHQAAAAAQTLTEPDVAVALTAPPPDVELLRLHAMQAIETARGCSDGSSSLRTRADQLDGLLRRLDGEWTAWQPVRQQHLVAQSVSSLAEGTSVDNHYRMSLSAYVLAARLEQVVAAANERFTPMTGGRYALEHTALRTARDNRGGLGLLVRDDWTGQTRDPKTLSGGETFQASLALALGLAQVVSQEAGGVQMQTLFVDEGFGSLDSETLDEVMDQLDTLRSGGRVVGVVSHVAAMRDRITARIEVTKSPNGSAVSQHAS